MAKFYVTYGSGYAQGQSYSVVEAPSYQAARTAIAAVCGSAFAFAYTEEDFAGQAQRYGLTEIALQPQTAF